MSADPGFITSQKERLCGLVITHAHEDHVGAVPYLWPRLRCPVYATPFTAEVLRRKLAQHGMVNQVPIVEVGLNAHSTIGPFSITWLQMTHSIPEPSALVIRTQAGNVFHTADWKIDAQPVTGQPFNANQLAQLQHNNICALVGDSTNATKPGFSVSERNCFDALNNIIAKQTGRVVVICFGSNVARLISLARIAAKTGRYMSLFGRSLVNMVGVARQTGYWPESLSLVDPSHVGYLLPEEVLVVATGSQGEPRAALNRLADDAHSHVSLEKGDTVIFSSMVIPGNEREVSRLKEKLANRGIHIIAEDTTPLPVHASGHPCQEELKLMYRWVKPQMAVPTHGEPAHLTAHAACANECGIKKQIVGRNGDLYLLAPVTGIQRAKVKIGRLPLQSN